LAINAPTDEMLKGPHGICACFSCLSRRSVDPARGAPPVEDAAERCPVKRKACFSEVEFLAEDHFGDFTGACILFTMLNLLCNLNFM
jgi:hypothetical protein